MPNQRATALPVALNLFSYVERRSRVS